MTPTPAAPPTDEELRRLIEEAVAQEALLEEIQGGEDDAPPQVEGDPCTHCSSPALALDACSACGEDGCLPRDDWVPGMSDPCLTRCVRCAMHVHLDCTREDWTGNPLCYGCRGG